MSLFHKTLLAVTLVGPGTAFAADTAGCKDLRLVTRVPGCTIVECTAKRIDAVRIQMDADRQEPVEGPASLLRYSCPAPATLDTVAHELAPSLKRAGFNVVYQDVDDATSRVFTAQKGNQWIGAEAAARDAGGVDYTLSSVESGPARPLMGEICTETALFTLPKGCSSSECNSKRSDSVEMRKSTENQVALTGALRSSAIACTAAIGTTQLFDAAQAALKVAGFELVFTQRERPEYSWLTMRSGKRWVEFMSFQDGESIAYQLTDVLAESVKAAEKPAEAGEAKPSPVASTPPVAASPAPALEPPPPPAPAPEANEPVKTPEPEPVPPSPSPPSEPRAAAIPPAPVVPTPTLPPTPVPANERPLSPALPPRPLRRTPINVTEEVRKTLTADIVVNVMADVDEQGFVVKAALAPECRRRTPTS